MIPQQNLVTLIMPFERLIILEERQVFQDTFFEVNLGAVTITNNVTFNIEMNIAEWFKNQILGI